MITDVVKYFIMGTKTDLHLFFERAQEQGFMEFISPISKKSVETPIPIQSLTMAIKILRKQPLKDDYLGGGDLLMAMQLSERILELKDELERLYEEKRLLETEIVRVAPFGYFSMDDITYIERRGGRTIQFFCMKTAKSHTTSFPDEIIYVGTEYDLDYFITLASDPIVIPGMIEMRIDAPLGELENRVEFVDDAIERFEVELKDLAGYIGFLQHHLVEELNKYNLVTAKKEVAYPLQNSLFVIEAWVPHNKVTHLFGLIDGMDVHAEQLLIESDDKKPTCLENRGMSGVGEDLIKIYDTPATTDKDPSTWVVWFFALFFAVIVGDGGYGLLFLGLAFYLKKKFPHIVGSQKRMLRLLFLLSTACVVWGVFASSYFGLKLSPTSPLAKISPLQALVREKASFHLTTQDDVYHIWLDKFPQIATATSGEEMLQMTAVVKKGSTTYQMVEEFTSNIILEMTILMGMIHITLAFLRYLRRNFAGLGWISFMIGGYLFFPTMLNATTIPEFVGWISKPIAAGAGIQCLYGGLAFALIVAIIQHRWKGLGEIANLVQVFADVLSYLRLYALSLAGSIMASTFNQEGAALGLAAGFVVILAGHGINMLLSFMGGVIHGLRLNFLEWYHYCFDGGGRLFKPLRKLKFK